MKFHSQHTATNARAMVWVPLSSVNHLLMSMTQMNRKPERVLATMSGLRRPSLSTKVQTVNCEINPRMPFAQPRRRVVLYS